MTFSDRPLIRHTRVRRPPPRGLLCVLFALGAALIAPRQAVCLPQAESARRWPVCHIEQALASRHHLRLLARLVSLSGEQLLHGRPLSLRAGGRLFRCEPPGCTMRRKRFADQPDQPLELALLIESSLPYQPLFADLQAALADFLSRLPAQSRLLLFPVGAEPPSAEKAVGLAEAQEALRRLQASADVEVRLIDSVRTALASLHAMPEGPGRSGLPARRVVVVLGGGLDTIMVPLRFAQLGDDLAKAAVPLFSVALSPKNHQLPMLGLAELSFRSSGTFRWVRLRPESSVRELVHEQLVSLAEELGGTEVVTLSGPRVSDLLAALPPSAALTLDCGETLSRAQPIRHLSSVAGPRRVPLGIALGLAVTLGLAALLWLRKRGPAT